MIIAPSYAQLDHQRIGWLPRFIRSKIREWGFSAQWTHSLKQIALIEAWMIEEAELQRAGKKLTKESVMLWKTELPLLKKAWDAIAKDRSRINCRIVADRSAIRTLDRGAIHDNNFSNGPNAK